MPFSFDHQSIRPNRGARRHDYRVPIFGSADRRGHILQRWAGSIDDPGVSIRREEAHHQREAADPKKLPDR